MDFEHLNHTIQLKYSKEKGYYARIHIWLNKQWRCIETVGYYETEIEAAEYAMQYVKENE